MTNRQTQTDHATPFVVIGCIAIAARRLKIEVGGWNLDWIITHQGLFTLRMGPRPQVSELHTYESWKMSRFARSFSFHATLRESARIGTIRYIYVYHIVWIRTETLSVAWKTPCKSTHAGVRVRSSAPPRSSPAPHSVWTALNYSYRKSVLKANLLTLCGLTSQKTHRGGLGLGGLVHEEAHPCFPYFTQTPLKRMDAGSTKCPLIQLIPSINYSVLIKSNLLMQKGPVGH